MNDSTILITGGTSGIGLATARLLRERDVRVIVTGRQASSLAAARADLGDRAIVLESDAASTVAIGELAGAVRAHATRLDGIFLNAGVARFGPIEAMTPERFDEIFNVNVRGLYFELQALLPLLASPASVVLNASAVAHLGLANMSLYAASKAAVVSLGRSLAAELAPRGIRVNTVSPGPIRTPIYEKLGVPAVARTRIEERFATRAALGRFGSADEAAQVVRFLLSSEASYVTGADFAVDGGVRIG